MTGRLLTGFLISTKTAIWLLCLLTLLLFAGAFIMPSEEAFQSIHSVPLLQWMREQPAGATWWLWGSALVLFMLAVNTLFCSIDSIIKKRRVTQWMLLISPQIIHTGFLFMLLAHLLSSMGGFKVFGVAAEGTVLDMPDNSVLEIKRIHVSMDPRGYIIDWAVNVEYRSGGMEVKEERLMPNKPVFQKGVGVYVRDLRAFPTKMLLIEMSREPGAAWALAGAVLFMIGTLTLLVIKMRREGRE